MDIPRDPAAPATARSALRELGETLDTGCAEEVSLLVSELITNSVRYGAGPTVRLIVDVADGGRLLVSVIDDGRGFVPVQRSRPVTESGGWGLHLVEQLSDRWGVDAGAGGVWFEVDHRSELAAA